MTPQELIAFRTRMGRHRPELGHRLDITVSRRVDEHYEWRESYGEMSDLSRPPSEYFRPPRIWAVECDEEFVAHVVDVFGDDNLVTTTDYPHGDSKYPNAMDRFRSAAQ